MAGRLAQASSRLKQERAEYEDCTILFPINREGGKDAHVAVKVSNDERMGSRIIPLVQWFVE